MDEPAARAFQVFPGGISNGEYGLPADDVVVMERGDGCKLWDTDGNEYLDFSMAWGSCLVSDTPARRSPSLCVIRPCKVPISPISTTRS